jgi:hypothetical protein
MKLLKKTLALLLTFVMVFGVIPLSVFAEDDPALPTYTVELLSDKTEVNGGEEVCISVKINGASFNGFIIDVKYDADLFTFASASGSMPQTVSEDTIRVTSRTTSGTDGTIISRIWFKAAYTTEDAIASFEIVSAEVHNPEEENINIFETAAVSPDVNVTVKATEEPSLTIVLNEEAMAAGVEHIYTRNVAGDIDAHDQDLVASAADELELWVWLRKGFEDSHEFKGWRIKNDKTGDIFEIADSTVYLPYSEYAAIEKYSNIDRYDSEAYVDSGLYIFFYDLVGQWTLEPIFEEKQASYEFSFDELESDTVDAGEDISLDIIVDGAAYESAQVTVTYDADLFEYKSCTEGLTVTEGEGTVTVSGSGLEKEDGDEFASLVFTAKSTQEGGTGTFTITEAKAGASEEALVDATAGDPVNVTVNAALEDITVTPYGDAFILGEDYSIEGNVVTVTFDIPCKVGYLDESGNYVAIEAVPVEGEENTYSFTAPEGITEVVLVIKGDANLDGDFTNNDVTIAKAASLGRNVPFAELNKFAADMSGEGEFSNYDVTLLKAVSLGRYPNEW